MGEEQEAVGSGKGRGHEQQVSGTKRNTAVLATERRQRGERPGLQLCPEARAQDSGAASAQGAREKCRSARSWC